MHDNRGGRLIIPPGQERLLRRMLASDLPEGFTFVGARTHADWVEAKYERAGQSVALRLEHPGQSDRAGVDTRAFRIVAPAAQALDELVQTLARSIAALEADFHWDRPPAPSPPPAPPPPDKRTLDIEWLAFRAGIKPALRISCEAADADQVAQRYVAGGAHVRRALRIIEGQELVVVYVARTRARAEQLRRVEGGKGRLAWLQDPLDDNRVLGTLLGYPRCCVRAYDRSLRIRARENDWYRSARAAWIPRPAPRLNALLMVEGRSLLSFDPCRYDCPAALELADRVADAVREADREWLEYAEGQLALPITVDRRGARAHVELDRNVPGGRARIIRAWAPASVAGDSRKKDLELADRLPGLRVSRQGLVEESRPIRAPVVVDFPAGR